MLKAKEWLELKIKPKQFNVVTQTSSLITHVVRLGDGEPTSIGGYVSYGGFRMKITKFHHDLIHITIESDGQPHYGIKYVTGEDGIVRPEQFEKFIDFDEREVEINRVAIMWGI